MALPLLKLPPEILLQILSNLSVKPLLRFARTSQYSRSLAYTELRELSLAICPSHRASWHNKLFRTQYKPAYKLQATVQIPQAQKLDYATLLTFHNKLTANILSRHAFALQKLDLTLWTLSPSIAAAITTLPALRNLCIRLANTQTVPRAYVSLQRKEEFAAWTQLASGTSWTYHLKALQVENAEISASQLMRLVNGAARLQDLRLSNCDMLTSSIWDATEFSKLHYLAVTDCANVHVNEAAVGVISKMQRLQVLDLHGCNGMDGEVLEQWNRDVWRVPVFVAPRPRGYSKQDLFLEVDPDYMV